MLILFDILFLCCLCFLSFKWIMPSLCFLSSQCSQPPKTTTTTGTKTSAKEDVVRDKEEGVHQRGWLRGEGLWRHQDPGRALRCPGVPRSSQLRGAELGPQGHEADAGLEDWLCDQTKQEQIKVKGSSFWCSVNLILNVGRNASVINTSQSQEEDVIILRPLPGWGGAITDHREILS